MNKRADFAADLEAITSEVATDVGGILEVVKARKTRTTKEDHAPTKVESTPVNETADATEPKPDRARRVRTRTKQEADEPIILENVTTRLRHDTNELLTEASLRQRLKKLRPATRQDIIEAALQDWLQRNAYL